MMKDCSNDNEELIDVRMANKSWPSSGGSVGNQEAPREGCGGHGRTWGPTCGCTRSGRRPNTSLFVIRGTLLFVFTKK